MFQDDLVTTLHVSHSISLPVPGGGGRGAPLGYRPTEGREPLDVKGRQAPLAQAELCGAPGKTRRPPRSGCSIYRLMVYRSLLAILVYFQTLHVIHLKSAEILSESRSANYYGIKTKEFQHNDKKHSSLNFLEMMVNESALQTLEDSTHPKTRLKYLMSSKLDYKRKVITILENTLFQNTKLNMSLQLRWLNILLF
ncbi:Hypothetical_protein [Hexamita inflata]|uniref:Hypothetical_protein n=1 Tax=Hexamita inflata TaxID=28002 RepID=A0AA86VEA5_9EUKA|nr:Hypothetical protein HINF_LOCUS51768 [Hexamita inflata]